MNDGLAFYVLEGDVTGHLDDRLFAAVEAIATHVREHERNGQSCSVTSEREAILNQEVGSEVHTFELWVPVLEEEEIDHHDGDHFPGKSVLHHRKAPQTRIHVSVPEVVVQDIQDATRGHDDREKVFFDTMCDDSLTFDAFSSFKHRKQDM